MTIRNQGVDHQYHHMYLGNEGRKPSLWGAHDILKGDIRKTNRHLNGILGGFDTSSRFFHKLAQCQIAPHNWWVHEKIEHTGSS